MSHESASSAKATRTAERITVTLVPKAADDLAALQERTGLSKTDLVNRALTAYDFIEGQMSAGAEILVRRGDETHLVAFL